MFVFGYFVVRCFCFFPSTFCSLVKKCFSASLIKEQINTNRQKPHNHHRSAVAGNAGGSRARKVLLKPMRSDKWLQDRKRQGLWVKWVQKAKKAPQSAICAGRTYFLLAEEHLGLIKGM